MGQYWTMKNLDKRESLSTHAFGCGLKYLEQWFSGPLYTAIMVLLTDLSSLGHGSGDFDLDKAPTFLKQFITPMIGRWAGDRVIFSGDYTEALTLNHGDELFVNISDKTALSIWAMVACDMIECNNVTIVNMKDKILEFLNDQVCNGKSWENEESLKPLLTTIDKLAEQQLKTTAERNAALRGPTTTVPAKGYSTDGHVEKKKKVSQA